MATKKGPGKPRREAMSRVDTAWLRMCRPTNPMMITGVLMFDEPMTLERLKQVIRKRFLAYPRFLQKAVDTAAGAAWVEDTNFDIDWHVRLSALPGRSDPQSEKRALERFVSQMASTPLDKTKPLWQFHLVERYRGGSALVARIHHSYADGIALVQVLLSLTDTTRKPDRGSELRAAWLKQDGVEVVRRVGAIDRYVKLGGKMLGKGMEMYRDPTLATMLAKEGGEIGRELLAALALSDDPPTLLRGPLGVSKRVAWAEPLDLEEVKAVGRACDCTVNDVLMATAAGALRSYLIERGENVDGVTLRATVPVNLRPLEHARKLGNHFRSGVPGSAGRRGQSDPPGGAGRQLHEQLEEFSASHCCIWTSCRAWDGAGGAARRGTGALQPQGHRGGHQCPRAAATALHYREPGPRHDVLGAADRFHRHRRVDPQLQRPCALRSDRRRQAGAGSGCGDPPVRAGVREAVVSGADGELGLHARRRRGRVDAGGNHASKMNRKVHLFLIFTVL